MKCCARATAGGYVLSVSFECNAVRLGLTNFDFLSLFRAVVQGGSPHFGKFADHVSGQDFAKAIVSQVSLSVVFLELKNLCGLWRCLSLRRRPSTSLSFDCAFCNALLSFTNSNAAVVGNLYVQAGV
jgi:hypothetical protein